MSDRQRKYPRPAVTVDVIVLTVVDAQLRVLLIQRGQAPFKGAWALPGGFVRVGSKEQGEDLPEAAERELHEETGLPAGSSFLFQLGAFGTPGRDPRMRVITVAYCALLRPELAAYVEAGSDASLVRWVSLDELEQLELAFDHSKIIEAARAQLRAQLTSSDLALHLVPRTFTIEELRAVHEAINESEYDASNFRRRFKRLLQEGLVEQTPGKRHTRTRPAKVYRAALR